MESVTATKLKCFNNLQSPEKDDFGKRNHYHFGAKALRAVPGEAILFANQCNRHYESEGQYEFSRLSPAQQAEMIVSLPLEAFVNYFNEPGSIRQMGSNIKPFAPFTWSTTDEPLARTVSARCQALGIRLEKCNVGVSTTEEIKLPRSAGFRGAEA
jgi:hypothetical protein